MSPASADKVTVLLTLFGRPLFTLRWMWHANRIGLPFQVLIADGERDNPLAPLLEDKSAFPNLSYRYLRYDDHSLPAFYAKVADAAAQVDTPYVMLADNDDFLSVDGTLRAVEWLESHPDYVTVGGRAVAFETVDPPDSRYTAVMGSTYTRWLLASSAPRPNFESTDRATRIAGHFTGEIVTYYNVSRSDSFRRVADATRDAGLADLLLHECMWGGLFLAQGKVRLDGGYVGHYRQQKTSTQASRMAALKRRVLDPTWSRDVAATLAAFEAVSGPLGDDRATVLDAMAEQVALKCRVKASPGKHRPPLGRRALAAALHIARPLLPARRMRLDRERHRLLLSLSAEARAAVAAELKENEATLTSPEMKSFLDRHAPT